MCIFEFFNSRKGSRRYGFRFWDYVDIWYVLFCLREWHRTRITEDDFVIYSSMPKTCLSLHTVQLLPWIVGVFLSWEGFKVDLCLQKVYHIFSIICFHSLNQVHLHKRSQELPIYPDCNSLQSSPFSHSWHIYWENI